jgi:hypothetical protein
MTRGKTCFQTTNSGRPQAQLSGGNTGTTSRVEAVDDETLAEIVSVLFISSPTDVKFVREWLD